MADLLPKWLGTREYLAALLVGEFTVGIFLWYGPLLLERSTVERFRPLAFGVIAIGAVALLVRMLAGGYWAYRLAFGLPALAYLAYTWTDGYLDRVERSRMQSAGGRRLGRWRAGVERSSRNR